MPPPRMEESAGPWHAEGLPLRCPLLPALPLCDSLCWPLGGRGRTSHQALKSSRFPQLSGGHWVPGSGVDTGVHADPCGLGCGVIMNWDWKVLESHLHSPFTVCGTLGKWLTLSVPWSLL